MSSGNRQTLSADGQTTDRQYVGPVRVSLSGDFGGGTAKVEVKDPSDNWIDVAGTSKTSAADFVIDFAEDALNDLRVDLSGATSPALVVWMQSSEK